MTNAKYHRCRRALDRLSRHYGPERRAEVERLREVVGAYQSGSLRAKNGRGSGRHSSNARA